MLQVHGEGDPSGRGEALSFIKTSMKGGFKAKGQSIAERMDQEQLKESQGHKYNVARQQQQYENSIRRVWEAQKQSLSSTLEHSDLDPDEEDDDDDDGDAAPFMTADTARSEGRLPGNKRSRHDDSASQSTKWSNTSEAGRIMEISRIVSDRYGHREEVKDIIRNPRVIREYLRRRRALDSASEE